MLGSVGRRNRPAGQCGRLAAAILALTALPLSAGTLLVSNFGPGNTYDTDTGDAWGTGGDGQSGNAVGFVDPFSSSYALSQLMVADNFFTASTDGGIYDLLNVGFWASSTDDLNSATEEESWTISTGVMQTAELFTLNSVLNPSITPSGFYFITETVIPDPSPGATQATWGWQWNDLTPPQTGYDSEFSGGSWFAETGTTPVFSVSGNLVTTPEPRSSAALFIVAMAGIWMLRRRASLN